MLMQENGRFTQLFKQKILSISIELTSIIKEIKLDTSKHRRPDTPNYDEMESAGN